MKFNFHYKILIAYIHPWRQSWRRRKNKSAVLIVNKTPNNGDQSKAFHGQWKDNKYFSAILRQ